MQPLIPEILDQTDPFLRKMLTFKFQPIFTCSAPIVTSSEKVKLLLIETPLHAFQWA